MSDAKIGSFEDLTNMTEVTLRPVLAKLRDVVMKTDPNAVEVVRLGDRAATYGVGPKKNERGLLLYFAAQILGEFWVFIKVLICPTLKTC